MKLGIICDKLIHELIVLKLKPFDVDFCEDADVYIVQKGYEDHRYPQLVFEDTDKIVELILMLSIKQKPKLNGDKIVVYKNEQYYMISFDKILFFEAQGSHVYCHTPEDSYLTKEKLYALEEALPSNQFIRTSKSFIININAVSKIIPWFNRRLLISFVGSSKEAEVSKNYSSSFKTFLGIR